MLRSLVGSEMCIRDSVRGDEQRRVPSAGLGGPPVGRRDVVLDAADVLLRARQRAVVTRHVVLHLDVKPVLAAKGAEVEARARELADRAEAGVEASIFAGRDAGGGLVLDLD